MEQIFSQLSLSPWLVWLILAAVFTIVELLTGTFAFFCLVGGCLLAMLTALLGFEWNAQMIVAAVGTVIAFVAFRPLIRRQRRQATAEPSNMDALIGRNAVVMSATDAAGIGRLRIDGGNWQFRTPGFDFVEQGTAVRVTGYDSIVLIVEPV